MDGDGGGAQGAELPPLDPHGALRSEALLHCDGGAAQGQVLLLLGAHGQSGAVAALQSHGGAVQRQVVAAVPPPGEPGPDGGLQASRRGQSASLLSHQEAFAFHRGQQQAGRALATVPGLDA